MRVVVCEHGASNVRSVVRAIARAAPRAEVVVTADPSVVERAERLVVPGQGSFAAFAAAMGTGLGDAIRASIERGVPYLGICLGLQVLFERSEEAPGAEGLGVFRGDVVRLATGGRPLPHMGWNVVEPAPRASVLPPEPTHFYFAHSYAAVPEDSSLVAATTNYGGRVVSAIAKDAILGVQFHPEKSQRAGIALLERFFAS